MTPQELRLHVLMLLPKIDEEKKELLGRILEEAFEDAMEAGARMNFRDRIDFKDLHVAQMGRCMRDHADAKLLTGWIKDPKRPPAGQAFMEGPERDVAFEIETALGEMFK